MKHLSCTIFVDILLLLGVVYLFSMCSDNRDSVVHKSLMSYDINHYIDTIDNAIILTTVCSNNSGRTSVSTLKLN